MHLVTNGKLHETAFLVASVLRREGVRRLAWHARFTFVRRFFET